MDLSQLFVLNLKKWRKNRGLSQKTLAERCGAAHSYVRQIESGRGHPSFLFIGRLADALDIEPSQLFDNEMAHKKPLQSRYIETLKKGFLEKVSEEFDRAIGKLKK